MGRLSPVFSGLAVLFLLLTSISLVATPGMAPVVLTSPISDSMEPTITQDELLLVSGGQPEVGDLILFQSNRNDRDVLHRVVNTTDDGAYITQGDANDRTDQEEGMDPVTPDRVYGAVVTIDGDTYVSISFVGAVITNPSVVLSIWFLIAMIGFGPIVFGGEGRGRYVKSSPVENAINRKVIVAVAVGIMLLVPVAVIGTPTTENATIVTSQSTEPGEDAQRTVAVGHSTNRTIEMTGGTLLGMTQTAHLEGDLRLEEVRSPPLEPRTEVVVSNPPREEPGGDTAEITMYTYPATLPSPVLSRLANVHPALAGLASGAVIAIVIVVVTLVFVDPNRTIRQRKETIRRHRRR